MNHKRVTGFHSVRSGGFSGSKATNLTPFDPIDSAIDKIYHQYKHQIKKNDHQIDWIVEKVHDDFIMPVSKEELKTELEKVPKGFINGLKGVFLLGGSKKQEKVFYSDLFYYGTYWKDCIFFHPFPKQKMQWYYKRAPKPSILNEYKRVGALVSEDDQEGITIRFNRKSLKAFYLRDVFVHEIGHHVDRHNTKSDRKKETFAEWFADEYGFTRQGLLLRN